MRRYSTRFLLLSVTACCIYFAICAAKFRYDIPINPYTTLPFKALYVGDSVELVYPSNSGTYRTLLDDKQLIGYVEGNETDSATLKISMWELLRIKMCKDIAIR